MVCLGCATTCNLAGMVPRTVRGWQAEPTDAVYNADTLFDYIDGGAEVYRSFHVRKVLARKYVKSGAPEIVADIFDMGSSADAFGAYHHDVREGADVAIGQESEYLQGALSFWKGRYCVAVTAVQETDDAREAVLELGRAIAAAIPKEGPPPNLIRLLPTKDLRRGHVHYFHDLSCLNYYYFLTEENLLGLDGKAEGVLARYKPEGSATDVSWVLFLIRYPSPSLAREAHARFLRGYLPDADSEGAAQTENGKWAAAVLRNDLIVGVFDAPSKDDIVGLIDAIPFGEN